MPDVLGRLSDVGDDDVSPVTVRAATAADVQAIQRIYAPLVTDTFDSFEESDPDVAELTRRMLAGREGHGWSPPRRVQEGIMGQTCSA